jgi:signal transduction histidine kinase
MSLSPAEAEKLIAQLQEDLRERDDLLAMAAHELRNPLHGLALQLRLVRIAAEDGRDHADTLTRLAKAELMLSRYADRLTLLLDLTRLNAQTLPVNPREVDLSAWLAALVDNLAPDAQFRNVAVRLLAPPTLLMRTDPALLEQVVANLMLNAFKHAACTQVTLTLRGDADTVEIGVDDNGRGIAPADQQRIFGKFSVGQATEPGTGTGLGLWIVRKLLDALGGTITLTSRPQAGSVFTLRLPTDFRADVSSP